MWEIFTIRFAPNFIMTDADNAQFNACSSQLPDSKILMCWFHVCQNVKGHITKAKLAPVTIDMISRDLNILILLVQREISSTTCTGCVEICIYNLFVISSSRRSHHKTVDTTSKVFVVASVSHVTGVCHHHQPIGAQHPVVPERLKALYKLTVPNKELCATPIGSSSDMPVQLMTILHRPLKPFCDRYSDDADDFYFDDPRKVSKPYKSMHILRMQWKNMPNEGWVVDARHGLVRVGLTRSLHYAFTSSTPRVSWTSLVLVCQTPRQHL
ncbi:hypothetical protein PHMEG_0008275 [Phytophthora megakarya]|uniref:MULE transposase domain-containing protein n=1 Tax=Phytophthora megakarya TaxID=4795 RepID=A0A225WK01_9STRA|nr:hypothetical protein PHMEG_0008275 [Phytophthora megakarya]